MNLFKHAACFGDIHWGLKNNSRQHNQDCMDFVKWFIKEAKKRNCETCIFMGDWHHIRSTVNVVTLNYSVNAFELLAESFDQVYVIAGNHDLFYRERRDLNSFPFAKHSPNVTIVCDDIFDSGNVSIVPWLIGTEWKKMRKIKSRYIFGHFELPDFYMNSIVKMPNHHNLQADHFDKPEYVFSGHFHRRQNKGNIHYIGNPFGHNYADTGDKARGAMFLKWDGEPEFVDYYGPQYLKINLSTLIDEPEVHLNNLTFCQVILDIPINYEEANFIKETFMTQYSPRELKLIPIKRNMDESTLVDETTLEFKTIQEIIDEQIESIDSDMIDKKMLLDLYKSL